MLRKIIALGLAGAAFAIGYMLGAVGGFKVAVTDYVENDAQRIEAHAEEMYGSNEEQEAVAKIQEAIEQKKKKKQEGETARRGFQ